MGGSFLLIVAMAAMVAMLLQLIPLWPTPQVSASELGTTIVSVTADREVAPIAPVQQDLTRMSAERGYFSSFSTVTGLNSISFQVATAIVIALAAVGYSLLISRVRRRAYDNLAERPSFGLSSLLTLLVTGIGTKMIGRVVQKPI